MSQSSATSRGALAPLLASDFLLSTLAAKDGKRSTAQVVSDVKAFLTKERALAAFEELVRKGHVTDKSGRATLTRLGVEVARARFGHLLPGESGRKQLERVIWPALVLGINPASKAAGRLARGENLRAASLTVVFSLPLDKEKTTLGEAISTLLVRGLSGVFPQPSNILKAQARSLGDLTDTDALRRGLVLAGIALSSGQPPRDDDLNAFAKRVQAIADTLSTPPFARKVAISQVYDAYGKRHPDAGRLETFKARLLDANVLGALGLYPLDEPGALDPEIRGRSLIETSHGRYHFVARSS
jgi:hypothetical protein